jgi:hypothetical protein
MENLKLYEAFGKGPANAVNPLFKKNFNCRLLRSSDGNLKKKITIVIL